MKIAIKCYLMNISYNLRWSSNYLLAPEFLLIRCSVSGRRRYLRVRSLPPRFGAYRTRAAEGGS